MSGIGSRAWKAQLIAHLPFHQNTLLSQLDPTDRARLNGSAELVSFNVNDDIFEVDEQIEDIWFPISGMISVVAEMEGGDTVEVSAVGSEGIVGFEAYLGVRNSKRKQMGQIKGQAIVLPLKNSRRVFCEGRGLKPLLLFVHSQIIEASQSAACNRVHSAEERLARWLLITRDRIQSDELNLTHEFLSMMLGRDAPPCRWPRESFRLRE
jgi:CRP-like cAMP-binding protein